MVGRGTSYGREGDQLWWEGDYLWLARVILKGVRSSPSMGSMTSQADGS